MRLSKELTRQVLAGSFRRRDLRRRADGALADARAITTVLGTFEYQGQVYIAGYEGAPIETDDGESFDWSQLRVALHW